MIFPNIRFYDSVLRRLSRRERNGTLLVPFIPRGNSFFLHRAIRHNTRPQRCTFVSQSRGSHRAYRYLSRCTYFPIRPSENAITTHNEVNSGERSYVLVIRKGWNELWRWLSLHGEVNYVRYIGARRKFQRTLYVGTSFYYGSLIVNTFPVS